MRVILTILIMRLDELRPMLAGNSVALNDLEYCIRRLQDIRHIYTKYGTPPVDNVIPFRQPKAKGGNK